jgi:hypothetical protein
MIDKLPRRVGWVLLAVGLLCIIGGMVVAIPASLVGWLVVAGSVLYLAIAGFLLRTGRIHRAFVITSRLIFPTLIGVLLLESAAQQNPSLQALSAGSAAIVGGVYLVQIGVLRLQQIALSFDAHT